MPDLAAKATEIEARANAALSELAFDTPVTHVYNPLEYAQAPHRLYLDRFLKHRPKALLLGMNPGPYGMAQTGVPFGEVAAVRDWLGITSDVAKPLVEHPKRPIEGFNCKRSEVSGRRLWGWAEARWGSPDRFFDVCFVHNYCPLVFMADTGRNITPDKLKKSERDAVYVICDQLLADMVELIQPQRIVGVGAFAEQKALAVCGDYSVSRMPHPSPASPAANRGWDEMANAVFDELGL
jgi:single-strand selective monofunctional uracil DNA glycosylase